MSTNRFAHLKGAGDAEEQTGASPDAGRQSSSPPPPARVPARVPAPPSDQGRVSLSPALPLESTEALELPEIGHLVERKVGILGRIPARLKDDYDQMLLASRKYIGRPNADLAVQAWVELILEDEALQRRWLRKIQDLRGK